VVTATNKTGGQKGLEGRPHQKGKKGFEKKTRMQNILPQACTEKKGTEGGGLAIMRETQHGKWGGGEK